MSTDSKQVVISGVGVITCFGVGIDPLWEAMCQGKTGIARIQRFDPSGFTSQVAGELSQDDFNAVLWTLFYGMMFYGCSLMQFYGSFYAYFNT